ncbi:BREX-1 system adenine-specific DNA-methyltransferase PglX [Agathobacter sp.]|uniref:BREX-1 system adenine-specific DNA-methyltransferase PglX n=1 Tax=Agathobacter sp. TaxID=2021311 RepID=UPI003AB1C0C2
MNKNAIKKFAIDARNKLIASVTDKAGMLGITPDNCSEAITKGADFEVYKTAAGTEVTLNKKQCEQRRKLVDQIYTRGFEAVVEEVAYTWFNRICAIRFMEVNDYMYPVRVRVLSSEKEGKNEPDVVTMAPDIDWDFTDKEREEIIDAKMNNRLDDLFRMLFIKQCNLLHEVLPGLFEETEDYTEMLLNISFTNEDDVIRMLVDEKRGIPEEDFNVNTIGEDGQPTGQVEIIGWLYQYYNTELKDDTFAKLKKNVKITKERIPAATQLFTPDWIVRYMVENSVGRIWIEHLRAVDPSTDEKATAEKFGWKYYLPEAEQEDEVNVKLAEIRTSYKDLKPTEITCIDPCMGSGHILIAMFDVLMDIYVSAGYDKREAAFEIVEHNIHGLDIDQRAYQLAYFAVMMKGRGYNRRFLSNKNMKHNIFKVQGSGFTDKEGKKVYVYDQATLDYFVNNDVVLKKSMDNLIEQMFDAEEYGSILKIQNVDFNLIFERFEEIESDVSLYKNSVFNALHPFVLIAYMLTKKYDAIITNPPYMGASGMNTKLSKYVKDNYPDSKSDLFAVFIEKWNMMTTSYGYNSMVTMQSWMFLSSFEKTRKNIINAKDIVCLMHMENMVMGIAFGTAVTIFRNKNISNFKGTYNYIKLCDIENNKPRYFPVMENRFAQVSTDNFSRIPGTPIAYWVGEQVLKAFSSSLLEDYGYPKQGFATGNNDTFLRFWHEVDFTKIGFNMADREEASKSNKKWFPCNKGGAFRRWYGNNTYLANWEFDGKEMTEFKGSVIRNPQFYFRQGMTWSSLTSGKLSMRYSPKGFLFESKGSVCFMKDENNLLYILGLMNTSIVSNMLLVLSPTLDYHEGPMSRVPIIISNQYKNRVEKIVKENIEMCKEDWDSFEISWDFKQHPLVKYSVGTIKEAFDIWTRECDDRYISLKNNEEELNRIFTDIYGLNGEVSVEVDEKDVSVHRADLQREIKGLISYAVGCMFGRYSVNEEGLMQIGKTILDEDCFIDKDNCIPITDEEYFLDDIVGKFCEWLKLVYGEDTLKDNLKYIANALGNKGKTGREIIREYFVSDFIKDHIKMYQKRPIYWLFDSGKQNGFKALIYMHRYDADTVGRVRTDYLHKAQKYVETAMQSAQYTIDNATSASEKSKATKAVTKYTKQLAEMKIYDEAIAHVANQRIEIDLDDGVKVNYAKFQGVEVAQEGKKALKVDLLAKI